MVLVVDASVVIKWFVPEVHGEAARRWLDSTHDFVAPDLLFAEVANIVWKKARRGDLTPVEAQDLVADITTIDVDGVPMRGLIADAHALAAATGITVYDATYLALAVRLGTTLVTADDRLRRSIAAHPMLAAHIRSVEDEAPEASS